MPVTAAVLAVSADPLGLLVAFGAGMLSFLSPCVLPLVPGYISMVSGLTAAELSAMGEHDRERVPAAVAAAGTGPPPGSGDETEVTTAEQLRVERGRVLRGILWFIAGFTVVFVVLGAAASAVGRLLLTHQLVARDGLGRGGGGLRAGARGNGARRAPAGRRGR